MAPRPPSVANADSSSPTIRSPQADILDSILWNRISSFWTKAFDPSDKQALNALYEAYMHVIDAEYIKLTEINQAKSLLSCPVFTQRRWLRLDLNKYAEMKAFLQFLRNAIAAQGSATSVDPRTLGCIPVNAASSRHWHISFPWVIPTGDPLARRTLNLSFPTEVTLVDLYQMTTNGDGSITGVRLIPNNDYVILGDGMSIQLVQPVDPGVLFEAMVGFDLSGTAYSKVEPTIVPGVPLSPNTVMVPATLQTGFPIAALVIRNAPSDDSTAVVTTNNPTFTTQRFFFPFALDGSGVQFGSPGIVAFPLSFTIQSTDIVQVFGMSLESSPGLFSTLHNHERDTRVLNASNADPLGTPTYTPNALVVPGIFGAVGFLGQQLQLFVNGELLDPNSYSYDFPSNTFTFKVPLTFPALGSVTVDLLFTQESRASSSSLLFSHIHFDCYKLNLMLTGTPARFDDGGTFDDGGVFDDTEASGTLYIIDGTLDPSSLELFVNGILQGPATYSVTQVSGRTIIVFGQDLNGKNVLADYTHNSLIYDYGLSDIAPGADSFGITVSTLSTLLNDVANLLAQFQAAYGSQITDVASLIQAAQVAAAGGNPLLTLFFDEYPLFVAEGYPLEAPNQPITSAVARALASSNTNLQGIPFLVDQPLNPYLRLQSGVDYAVTSDGQIQSSTDLTLPRFPGDPAPGVWWCPLVLLDESVLAKNFGTLLGDVRPVSSMPYKNALVANALLRYSGPTLTAIANAAAVICGSPMFTQDSIITAITSAVASVLITVQDATGFQQEVYILSTTSGYPSIGDPIETGQSVGAPLIVALSALPTFVSWTSGFLEVAQDLGNIEVGDQVRIQLFSPTTPSAPPITGAFVIAGVQKLGTPGGTHTILSFNAQPSFIATPQSFLYIYRDQGPPYAAFPGTVTNIDRQMQVTVTTAAESISLPVGATTSLRPGARVLRGDAVIPDYAEVYNQDTRPNWYLLTPQQFAEPWTDGVPEVDERVGTITPAVGAGYATLTFSIIVAPLLSRGQLVTMVDDVTGATTFWTVVGLDGMAALLTPNAGTTPPAAAVTGLVTITDPPPLPNTSYFELASGPTPGMRPSSTLAAAAIVGSHVITLASVTNFPPSGRINIVLATGGMVEVEYFGISGDQLTGCVWSTDNESLLEEGIPGVLNPTVPSGLLVICVALYSPTIINPAFVTLVTERVTFDASTLTGAANVDAGSAPEFYALLKNTSTVLQLNNLTAPAPLKSLLDEITPPNMTLVVQATQRVVDSYPYTPTDLAPTQILHHTSGPPVSEDLPVTDNDIFAIAVDSVAGVTYIVGRFHNVNSIPRLGAAAFDTNSGALLPWDISGLSEYATGWAQTNCIILVGNVLYIGGEFGSGFNGGFVAVNKTTGALVSPSSMAWQLGLVEQILYNAGTLWVVGQFSDFGGPSWAAKIDATSFAFDLAFNPGLDNTVFAACFDSTQSNIYVGGNFSHVNGGTYSVPGGAAKVDAFTGVMVTAWAPNVQPSDNVANLTLSSDGNSVYIGGFFNAMGADTANGVAKVDAITGANDTAWPSAVEAFSFTNYMQVPVFGGYVWWGGGFQQLDVDFGDTLFVMDESSGTPQYQFDIGPNPLVLAVADIGDGTAFVAGRFSFTVVPGTVTNIYRVHYPSGVIIPPT